MLGATPEGDEDLAMADGHFQNVEALRRELAMLVLEWAGKAVKDDPEGAMSTALVRAVGEAARGAVAEQHHSLSAEAADRIAEALDRRASAAGLRIWRLRPVTLAATAATAAALLVLAFVLGVQVGRAGSPLPAESAVPAAPVAPLAPTADAPSAQPAARAAVQTQSPPPRAAKAAPRQIAPAASPAPRDLGRPAPASDEASIRPDQPVGAATAAPAANTTVPKP